MRARAAAACEKTKKSNSPANAKPSGRFAPSRILLPHGFGPGVSSKWNKAAFILETRHLLILGCVRKGHIKILKLKVAVDLRATVLEKPALGDRGLTTGRKQFWLSKTNFKGLAHGRCLYQYGRHNLRLTKESNNTMKTLVLSSVLAVGLLFAGSAMADTSVYNSKTTQAVSPAATTSNGGVFDGAALSSKGGSLLNGPSVAQAGSTSRTVACSRPMSADTCARHCGLAKS
jgi:hypothetical protein